MNKAEIHDTEHSLEAVPQSELRGLSQLVFTWIA